MIDTFVLVGIGWLSGLILSIPVSLLLKLYVDDPRRNQTRKPRPLPTEQPLTRWHASPDWKESGFTWPTESDGEQ